MSDVVTIQSSNKNVKYTTVAKQKPRHTTMTSKLTCLVESTLRTYHPVVSVLHYDIRQICTKHFN